MLRIIVFTAVLKLQNVLKKLLKNCVHSNVTDQKVQLHN